MRTRSVVIEKRIFPRTKKHREIRCIILVIDAMNDRDKVFSTTLLALRTINAPSFGQNVIDAHKAK